MSKTALIKEVETLLADVDKTHRYSMSRIYGSYNRVFGTNETPQSCASCLIRKIRELRLWLESEKLKAEKENAETLPTGGEIKLRRNRKRKEA